MLMISFYFVFVSNHFSLRSERAFIANKEASPPIVNLSASEAINAFSSQRYIYFIKEPTHKLLYCFIPKNACTKMKQLFFRLITGKFHQFTTDIELIHAKMESFKPSPQFVADKLLNDATWKSFVVLRDPLERLVSGFNDKCIRDQRHWCEGPKTKNFRVFVKRILDKMKGGNVGEINDHYRPQHTFCGLDEYFEHFDKIIYFHKASIAENTFQFMKSGGISHLYSNWNGHQNESMFDEKTTHSNSKDNDSSTINEAAFYSKYFDKTLAKRVMTAFQRDYQRLNIKYPQWVNYLKN